MKKICMVTTSEIFHDTRILSEAAVLARSYDVTILAKKYPNQKVVKYPFEIKLVNYRKFTIFQLNILSSFFALIKAAKKEKPDVFHGHDLDGLLCCFWAAIRWRKILVYDSHELWSETYPFKNLKGVQWLLPIMEKLMIWRVKIGLTVNESLAKYLEEKYHKHFIALYNIGINQKSAKSPYNFKALFPGKKMILHLGGADEGRGMEEMIKAAKILGPKYVLIFVGGGKTEEELKNIAMASKVTNVHFFDAVNPDEINQTVVQADLALALTQKISRSYYYSMPNKIFQYLQAKTPILGSNFPEFKKIILRNKIGEVVDPSSPQKIAVKIAQMTLKKSQQQYRRNLNFEIQKKYSWHLEGLKLTKLYEKIIS